MTIMHKLQGSFPTLVQAYRWWRAGLGDPWAKGGLPDVGRLPLDQGPDTLTEAARSQARSRGVALIVPEAHWLTLPLTLPQAGAEEQRRMAAFEIGEATPLTSDEVWFDLDQSAACHLVPKRIVEGPRGRLSSAEIEVGWLISDTGAVIALPRNGTSWASPWMRKAALGVAGFVALALVLGLVQSRRIAATDRALDTAVTEARSVRRMEAELAALRSGDTIRDGAPSVVAALERTTALLPDTSFLQAFEIAGRTVSIKGQGTEIEALARAIEADPMFSDVRLVGAVQTDDFGQSLFHIQAELQ